MTQEDKELLLKDLCARLPYEVKVCCNNTVYNIDAYTKSAFMLAEPLKPDVCLVAHIEEIKPYLFPMSSMTEEQKEEYHYIVNYISPDDTENWAEGEFVYVNQFGRLLHFYHINYLDWRGLIPKRIALDATGKNIY